MHKSLTETSTELQGQVHVLELLQNISAKWEPEQAQQP